MGTRFESYSSVQFGNSIVRAGDELDDLRELDAKLRNAMADCLASGRPHLAVALDTARDVVETVLADEHRTATRIALTRARAELALETWREANDVRH